MQTMQNPSFGGCPTPAKRYGARLTLALVAAVAVVPIAASVASAEPSGGRIHKLPQQEQPAPDPTDASGRFNLPLYPTTPKPKPTIVVGPVQPGGGITTKQPPVLVDPDDDPVDPVDPADPADPADPGAPAGPTDEAAPTDDPDDPTGGGSDDGSDDGSDGTGSSGDDGTGDGTGGSTGSEGEDGTALPGTAVDPSLAPPASEQTDADGSSGSSASGGAQASVPEGCDPTSFDDLPADVVNDYVAHGQCPVDPVKDAPPYALIGGLGLLGAGLVGLVVLAILNRPRVRLGS